MLNPLGQHTTYPQHYDPSLLCPIPRQKARERLGTHYPACTGYDYWHAYELSWLNDKGCPQVGMATWVVPADSVHIIESKSVKLYLNSLNQTRFADTQAVLKTLKTDLSHTVQAPIDLTITPLGHVSKTLHEPPGLCLDHLDVSVVDYQRNPEYLKIQSDEIRQETLHSHVLKSNCPVTGQPDWATVIMHYHGRSIWHEGLLLYFISLRQQQDFHEHCVEHMFTDIVQRCQPMKLVLSAHYTRRGGIDINPLRSTHPIPPQAFPRCVRQ